MGLAIATLIGGLLQLLVQLPSLGRVGFRFRPDFNWRDPGVRTILVLMGPATIAASAVQVNVMVNSGFASALGDGPMTWLNIAFRLMQLPLGIFGVAIATVTLPLVSRSAALGNKAEFRGALAHSIRLVMLLTIPSAIGLIILAQPIIGLIYQHGRFTADATLHTAEALRFYAIGLVGYSAVKVLAPAFYAIDKRNLPMLVSLASIGVNFGLNWYFTFHLGWGHRGLALSTSLVGDHQLSLPLRDDAPLRRPARNRRDDQDSGQAARGRRCLGVDLFPGAAFPFLFRGWNKRVARITCSHAHHFRRKRRILWCRLSAARRGIARRGPARPRTPHSFAVLMGARRFLPVIPSRADGEGPRNGSTITQTKSDHVRGVGFVDREADSSEFPCDCEVSAPPTVAVPSARLGMTRISFDSTTPAPPPDPRSNHPDARVRWKAGAIPAACADLRL